MAVATDTIYFLNAGSPDAEHDRLNTQHHVFTAIMQDDLLPPQVASAIATLSTPPKILDIATGSAIWLREIAKTLPAESELIGVDLDTSKFPPADSLPSNITLRTANMHEPFPEEMLGKFDVVHIRLIIFALKENLGADLAKNLMTLLKPGGYFVWTETGPLLTSVEPPSMLWYKFQDINYRFAKKVERDLNLPLGMRHYMEKAGFVECDDKAYPGNAQLYGKYGTTWIDRTNRLFKSFIAQTLRGIVSLGGVEGMSREEEAEELIRQCNDEFGNRKVHYLLVRAWGRKPATS
ncbi:hypothetical protein GGS20DRAFT_579569 [Poronia punctata]|nr:hypothetical protein GGS20DRAFT_579569 [Poronia punctata]